MAVVASRQRLHADLRLHHVRRAGRLQQAVRYGGGVMSRHEGQNLDKRIYSVIPVLHKTGKQFIEEHHYSKSAAITSVYSHGLFFKEDLCGALLWMPPTKVAAQSVSQQDWKRVLTLSRLAISPEAPRNAASFALSRSRKLIKGEGIWKHLVTYADTWQGHTGAIYAADNWTYVGKTKPSPVWTDVDGKVRGRKRGPKNLSVNEMINDGMIYIGSFPKHKYVRHL